MGYTRAVFQFLNGAIKIITLVAGGRIELHFNSLMVRLKWRYAEI